MKKLKEILEKIKANKNNKPTSRNGDAENNMLEPSNFLNKPLGRKHASNTKFDKGKSRKILFQYSDMSKLSVLSTPLGVVNKASNNTITFSGIDLVTGPTKNILKQNSSKSNTKETQE